MGIKEDFLRLIKNEGFKTNETITDALDDFVLLVEEENEEMQDDIEENAEPEDD